MRNVASTCVCWPGKARKSVITKKFGECITPICYNVINNYVQLVLIHYKHKLTIGIVTRG